MLKKIVVFDGGFGGELFADYIEEEIAIVDVIRVIDWRNLDKVTKNHREARKVAEAAIRPYIGRVDVIVFANYLISMVDLKYFKNKYKSQKFLGFNLPSPSAQKALILTTKALHETFDYFKFIRKAKSKIKTINCDAWVPLIDDAELTEDKIKKDLAKIKDFAPQSIVLAHTNFVEIKETLAKFFGPLVKFEDGYHATFRRLCSMLGFQGLDGCKK